MKRDETCFICGPSQQEEQETDSGQIRKPQRHLYGKEAILAEIEQPPQHHLYQ